jgi:hypothetical protein
VTAATWLVLLCLVAASAVEWERMRADAIDVEFTERATTR